jgi:formamidopyrimidine-DNA glycosylase
MPELPEVETVRRALAQHLVGRRVLALRAHPVRLREPLDRETLAVELVGRRFVAARRRGKYLLLDTEPPGALLVHLGMSGRLLIETPQAAIAPHTHLVLSLDDRRELRFVDPRRFGLVRWLAAGAEVDDPSLAALGVEPLDPSLPEVLPRLLRGRHAAVKALLLDQRLLAGVGNIYADEGLWRAGVRPTRPAGRLSAARVRRLAAALQEVLRDAVEAGGTTLRDYATPLGKAGSFRVALAAYGREKLPCLRCATPMRRSVIGGRSSFWCPRCQR